MELTLLASEAQAADQAPLAVSQAAPRELTAWAAAAALAEAAQADPALLWFVT
jgi:hypothetical protein